MQSPQGMDERPQATATRASLRDAIPLYRTAARSLLVRVHYLRAGRRRHPTPLVDFLNFIISSSSAAIAIEKAMG